GSRWVAVSSNGCAVAESVNQDGTRQESQGLAFGRPAFVILAALVFYVLSVGPVCKLADRGVVPYRFMQVVYAPLSWVAKKSPVTARFFSWYCKAIWKTRC